MNQFKQKTDGKNAVPHFIGMRFIASAKTLLVVAILLIPFLVVNPALAHGGIAKINPPDGSELETAPEFVQVWFDQSIVRGSGSLTVINGAGKRVDQGEVQYNDNNPSFIQIALQPDLPDGTYIITASATVVSDSHTASGSSVFWIGSKQSADSNQKKVAPAYEIMGGLLGLMLMAVGLGYWVLFRRDPPLAMVEPAGDVHHFPLE